MSRVLLIKCNEYVYPYAITHPLGLMYLSAVLKRDGGHEVRVVDTRPRGRMTVEDVVKAARGFGPDVIGLGALIVESGFMHSAAGALRAEFPRAAIVAGGPYASSYPEGALGDVNVDCAVMGEGESAFLEVVSRAASGEGFEGAAGVAVRRDGEISMTDRSDAPDINALPYPDWDSIDVPAYFGERRFSNCRPGKYMTMFTSRSCPYNCIYCHDIFGKGYRARSAEAVLAEMGEVHSRFGIGDFEIVDDTFNLNKKRVLAICEGIAAAGRKTRLYFPNALRGDLLDEEVVEALRKAGTVQATVAIETGSQRVQKLIKKNLDLEKARRAIELLTRAGIFTHGFFMLGFPTETEEELGGTLRFAWRSRLHSASFFIVKPSPGTELYEMAGGSSVEIDAGSFSYQSLGVTSSEIAPERLLKYYRAAFMRFYLNPFRMIRIFAGMPDKRFLLQSLAHSVHRMFFTGKPKK